MRQITRTGRPSRTLPRRDEGRSARVLTYLAKVFRALYPVAAAVTEFVTMALVDNPHRVGKELRDDLAGIGSARRGTYRVLYRINEGGHQVIVLRVEHRPDVYRSL